MKQASKVLRILLLCAVGYVLFIAVALFLLSYKGYSGQRTDLYSVAVNNVFNAYGSMSNGEVSYDPEIHVIETDAYGRTLFYYNEYHKNKNTEGDYGAAFVIMQGSGDGYAWYYPDKCYIPHFGEICDWDALAAQLPDEAIDTLKKQNDWGCEMETEKCARVPISKKKPEGSICPKDEALDKIIYRYERENGYTGTDKTFSKSIVYCEADCYGRELYYVFGMTGNELRDGTKVYDRYEYAIILNADGTCPRNGIVRITVPADSVTVIRELKQITNWNQCA